MNIICRLFGHKVDKKSISVTKMRPPLYSVSLTCPRCEKEIYVIVVPKEKK